MLWCGTHSAPQTTRLEPRGEPLGLLRHLLRLLHPCHLLHLLHRPHLLYLPCLLHLLHRPHLLRRPRLLCLPNLLCMTDPLDLLRARPIVLLKVTDVYPMTLMLVPGLLPVFYRHLVCHLCI